MAKLRPFDRILWWGNVRGLTLQERCLFASQNGFDALNIAPSDITNALDEGESLSSIRAMAEDIGIAWTYLDPVVSWVPDWHPGSDASDFVPFLQAGLGREFEFAAGLGIDRMLTITPFPPDRYDIAALADHLSRFAEKADGVGVTCVLEAMPMWGLRTLAEVEELRQQVQAPNVKLLFDTWHYMRGGRDDTVIARIPAGVIDHVQIADGALETPKGVSLFEDCLQNRVVPGAGDLPLLEILDVLRKHRHLSSVGPEVFSASFDTMSADDIAATLMPAFNEVLASHSDSSAH